MKLLSKIRKELYKISEVNELECDIDNLNDSNKDILYFLTISEDLRHKTDSEIINSFVPALKSNKDIAIKALFYLRDRVCGLGERRVFKVLINYLALNESEILIKNLHLIHKYGRWDDYYSLFYTPLEKDVIEIFKKQLYIDLNSKRPSLLGKWLKSENTSSKSSKTLAIRTRKLLGYTSKEYRLILSSLRRRIGVVERKMSGNNFKSINYNTLSLDTCLRYKNSFINRDGERYKNSLNLYKKRVESGYYKKDIQTFNQTPFNIIDLIINNSEGENKKNKDIYQELWNITCNRYKEIFNDAYVIMDIYNNSNSICSESYKIAIATMLFYKKLNSNIYKDYYMHFSPKAKFSKIQNSNIVDQVNIMRKINLSNGNNIEAAIDLLLFTSIKKDLKSDKIPKNILIISDLDLESKYKDSDKIQSIIRRWQLSGYSMPTLKFWQIEDNILTKGITIDKYFNMFASGYSKELFSALLKDELISYDELVLKTLENDRYNDIS